MKRPIKPKRPGGNRGDASARPATGRGRPRPARPAHDEIPEPPTEEISLRERPGRPDDDDDEPTSVSRAAFVDTEPATEQLKALSVPDRRRLPGRPDPTAARRRSDITRRKSQPRQSAPTPRGRPPHQATVPVKPLEPPPKAAPSRRAVRPTVAAPVAQQPPPTPPSSPGKSPTGQVFAGRYRLGEKLGKGGMGSVYLATQIAVDRKVAVKILATMAEEQQDVMKSRFKREARVIAALQHPNIVQMIDFGESKRGRLYLVMEYIDGQSFTELIKTEAPLDAGRVVDLAIQVLEALSTAHRMGVVHRDLKPDNLMLARNVGVRGDFVKVLDFGIAKVREGSPSLGGETLHTKTGLIVGSLRYISPDQVSNQEITAKTDLYSLGAILYELLCGRRVFDYEAPADCAIAHMSEEPRAPELDGTPMSGPLVDFIMMCLRKNPAERPASADAGVRMLRACRQNPLQAAIESPKTAPRRRPSGMDRSGRVPVPETVQAMPSTAPASGNQARPMMSRGPTTDNHARPMMSRTPTADDHALPVMSRTPPASGNHARPMMSRTPIGELAPVRAAPDVQEIETELEMLAPKQLVAATGPRNALDCTLDGNVEAPGVVTASVAPDALLRARQGGGGADGSRSSLGRTLGWAALLLALGAGAVAFYVYFVKPNI